MTKKLLSYQTKAVEATINHLLDNKEFKLQSPTGSGKTFIISQIIETCGAYTTCGTKDDYSSHTHTNSS